MALYRYVSSKDGLVDLMLDEVIAEVELPSRPARGWRADIEAIAVGTWGTVMRHGWYAQLVYTRPPLGPNMMRRTETMLEILTRQGVCTAAAMTHAAVIDRHIFGSALQAVEERAMEQRYGLTNPDELAGAITAVRDLAEASGSYPILSAWMADPRIASPTEQFELSLGFLLDGIAAQLRRRRPRKSP
jgi:AcrR family transcriptional regulator